MALWSSLAAVAAAVTVGGVVSRVSAERPQTIEIDVAGRDGVPTGAAAASITLAATRATEPGHVVVWPCKGAPPTTASLNYRPGPAVSNSTVVALGQDGRLCVQASTQVDLVVDLTATFGSGRGIDGLTPQRLVDTREAVPVPAGGRLELPVRSRSGVSADAVAAIVNVAATRSADVGQVIGWDCDDPRSEAVVLSHRPGPAASNTTAVVIGRRGAICLRSTSATDLVVDLNGVVTAAGGRPGPVQRLLDTRDDVRLPAGTTRRVTVGSGPAAVLTLTAVNADVTGYVVAWPCDGARPTTSNLNYTADGATTNTTITAIGSDGDVCLWSSAAAAVVVDLHAVFAPGTIDALVPQRLLDTRDEADGATEPIPAVPGSTTTVAPAPDSTTPIPNATTTTAPSPTPTTTTVARPTTTTTAPRGPSSPVSSGGFVDDFSTNTLDDWVFQLSDGRGWPGDPRTWTGDHATTGPGACGSPATTRNLRGPDLPGFPIPFRFDDQAVRDAGMVYWCDVGTGHMMTSQLTGGYAHLDFRPDRTFRDVTEVCWDQNVTDMGTGKWTEVAVVSLSTFNTNNGRMDYTNPIRNGDNRPGGWGLKITDGVWKGWFDRGTAFSSNNQNVFDGANNVQPRTNDKIQRTTHCVTDTGNGTIEMSQGVHGTNRAHTDTLTGSFPGGEVVVIFSDVEYNSTKRDGWDTGEHTWHWDTVTIT